jgi:DNA-directed RNA polymerase alpha subunit
MKQLKDVKMIVQVFLLLMNMLDVEMIVYLKNFGQKSLSEIEQVLIDRGLGFGMDLSKINLDDL